MNDQDPAEFELDEQAAGMLASFRQQEQIPGALHDRVWARVDADVAGAAVSTAVIAGPWIRRALIGTVAAAAAAALVWVSADALTTSKPEAAPVQAAHGARMERTSGQAAPGEVARPAGERSPDAHNATPEPGTQGSAAPDPVPTPIPDPAVDTPNRVDARHPPTAGNPTVERPTDVGPSPSRTRRNSGAADRKPGKSGKSVATPDSTTTSPVSTLGQELALIQQARQALLQHAPARATESLREHGKKFPKGAMAQERRALLAIAACEGNDRAAGRQRAEAFLGKHPTAALADRVRTACGLE